MDQMQAFVDLLDSAMQCVLELDRKCGFFISIYCGKKSVLCKTDTKSRSFGQLLVNMKMFHALQLVLVTFNLLLKMLIR